MVYGKRCFHAKNGLYIDDGIIKHGRERIVCPSHLKLKVMKIHHDTPLAGHRAYETVFASIFTRYFWINMATEVKEFVKLVPLVSVIISQILKERLH